MTITAAMVKDLRERTGSGMMECKKALTEVDGDIEAAVEALRKKGAASADKKAGRIAAEGTVAIDAANGRGVVVEVNCETDFVAKGDEFKAFAKNIAAVILQNQPEDVDALMMGTAAKLGKTVDEARRELIAKIGENINVRRFSMLSCSDKEQLGQYVHGSRLAVIVRIKGGDASLGKDLAMQIAASKPMCVSADQVAPDILDREKEIYLAQGKQEGKPEHIVEKIVQGRISKFLKEVTLLGQPFVKDPDISIEKLLKQQSAEVLEFVRLEVGEGLEKRADDFVSEVMAQAKGE